jgi:hypothetical protein
MVGSQRHAPAPSPRESPGTLGRSGRVPKISPTPGFEPVASP